MDTAQYRHSCHFSQVTLLPLSPLLSSPPLRSSLPSLPHSFTLLSLPTSSHSCPTCLLFCGALCLLLLLLSAFDDLSQAHGGEYSKGGYGGSAQSQAKSAGSGPGKGTHTTRVHTHMQSQWALAFGKNVCTHNCRWCCSRECSGERCVYARVWLHFYVHINAYMPWGRNLRICLCASLSRLFPIGCPPLLTLKVDVKCEIFAHQQWSNRSSSPFIPLIFLSALSYSSPFPSFLLHSLFLLPFPHSLFSSLSQHQDCQGRVPVEYLTWEVQSTAKHR